MKQTQDFMFEGLHTMWSFCSVGQCDLGVTNVYKPNNLSSTGANFPAIFIIRTSYLYLNLDSEKI